MSDSPSTAGAQIPFNRAFVTGLEQEYISQALANMHVSGNGPFTAACERFLEERLGAGARALLTTSCTHALEMAAILLDIAPGDEVILPSFTFVSTANAFALRGARLVFADIRSDTLNIDYAAIERAVTPRTKVVVPVHYAGVGCEMDAIMRLAGERGIAVVEDNAHGLLASYRGKPLGTFGVLATQSFHETKNFTCGEGGALVVNDASLVERAEIVREKGTNRSRFFRGQVDKYTWVDVGSSYVPSDLLAGFLLAQFQHAELIQTRRRAIWERYDAGLADWAAGNGVRLPYVPPECEQSFHMYYAILPSLAARTALIDRLKSLGIFAVFHYVPLHESQRAHDLGLRYECPVTDFISDRLLRLPFYTGLSPGDQDRVIEAIRAFRT